MGLTIELTTGEESTLRTMAAESGQSPERLATDALRTMISTRSLNGLNRELALLSRLTQGLPSETWRRYHELNRKRRDESIDERELRELLRLNKQVEAWNAERMELAFEIANLRGMSLNETLEQLGMLRNPE